MHIIRTTFLNLVSYGSIFKAIFIGRNTYTSTRKGKRANVTPITRPVTNNDMNFYYKRDSLNTIPQILVLIITK